ncbi:MAG: UDP-N-acetylmuramoyl-tripeptide--D-alanyl-D-alanine ligase [Treponema sp.]|jgi:UDP-N-acetylmuramoyl-tripeptide--D-alanyl-D-alanine ligase|nr:UDP-N-acetylmuramoyl-tripeptide--D-alanyl-D-alanine ligase [Treponema sp.]
MGKDASIIMDCTDLSYALGARLISFQKVVGGFSSVSIDSRTVLPGALFVALAGAAQDGHRYIRSAFERGAVAAMIARSRWEDPDQELKAAAQEYSGILLVVEDTLKSLQDAAAYYLNQFPQLFKIGITGSSGKTTVKEIAAAMISQEKAVVMNQGNLNSETGLPLSVFMVRPFHEVGIFELGMNRHGEIEEITRVLKPHIALITNIGSAHIGFFGNKQAIAEEKKAIFSQFSGNERALIPADDPYRDFLAEGIKGQALFYGSQCKELGSIQDQGIQGFEILWDGVSAHFSLPGIHNVQNMLAAAAIAKEIPIRPQSIRKGIESVQGIFGRSEILRGSVTLIRDCYNANPESKIGAIAMCDAFVHTGRRIYVIGAMLELGAESSRMHEMVGRRLAASKADLVCLYGKETQAAAEALHTAPQVPFFYTDSMEELSSYLSNCRRSGDMVLLKGSRGCALEGLTDTLLPELKTAEGAC